MRQEVRFKVFSDSMSAVIADELTGRIYYPDSDVEDLCDLMNMLNGQINELKKYDPKYQSRLE